jgi:hypothetical protein
MIRVHRVAASAAPFQRTPHFQSICRFLAWPGMSRHENERKFRNFVDINHKIRMDMHYSRVQNIPQNLKRPGSIADNAVSIFRPQS